LERHPAFPRLENALKKRGDIIAQYELCSLIQATKGPNKIINYCNINDYTYSQHRFIIDFIEINFPSCVIKNNYFSVDDSAKSENVRNHKVVFPGGRKARFILNEVLSSLS
jgi:hypothetical protein